VPGIIVNRHNCAEIFGVRDGTISKWVDAGMPAVSRPSTRGQEWSFNTAEVSKWLQDRAAKNASGDPSQVDAIELKRRKLKADAEMAEMEADRKGGLLVPVEWAVDIFGGQLDIIASHLAAIPARAAPLVFNQSSLAGVEAQLRRFVEEIKRELRDYGQELQRRCAEDPEIILRAPEEHRQTQGQRS
jgi:phage terminase Nu1 subunit (DNA packaging protein)